MACAQVRKDAVRGSLERDRREHTAKIVAALLLAFCVSRAVYVLAIEHPERPLFGIHLPSTPRERATAWLEQQPKETHVLADPGHAWKYGTSVRVAAGRDVFLEDVKDLHRSRELTPGCSSELDHPPYPPERRDRVRRARTPAHSRARRHRGG
jgi:hypothetical protein